MHLIASPAAATIRRLLRVPVAQYFHAEEIGARPRLAAFAAKHADARIAVSDYTAGLVRATGARGGQDARSSPTASICPSTRRREQADHPTILTVARIQERYKGHDVLVRALPLVRAKVPDAHWVVLGDGSLRPAVEALAHSYGVADSVRFLGVRLRRAAQHVAAPGAAAGDAQPPARRAASPARASGSPTWKQARTASRLSRATSAARSTRSSTGTPACSSIRWTRWRSPRRSARCCSTTGWPRDSARPAGARAHELAWPLIVERRTGGRCSSSLRVA